MGEKPVTNCANQLSQDEEAKKEAWKEHYACLLNVEFPWNPDDLSVEGPSEQITTEIITKAISKMASGKAAGPSGIVTEIVSMSGKLAHLKFVTSLRTFLRGLCPKATLSICTRAKGVF